MAEVSMGGALTFEVTQNRNLFSQPKPHHPQSPLTGPSPPLHHQLPSLLPPLLPLSKVQPCQDPPRLTHTPETSLFRYCRVDIGVKEIARGCCDGGCCCDDYRKEVG